MSQETRAIQDDDSVNPGMLSVLEGEGLWSRKDGASKVSCADCHTIASIQGIAARYPGFDLELIRPIDLEERINICRARRQNATPFVFESREFLGLTAFVGRQSRGTPIQVTIDERLKPFFDAGQELFESRQGQLNMSYAQCHNDNWGNPLGWKHYSASPANRIPNLSFGVAGDWLNAAPLAQLFDRNAR
jgi:L-cysteine S-thiosulfotransferase